MAKAYTPTVASSNTSSPVKTNMAQLSSPMEKVSAGAEANPNPHVRIGPQGFAQPSRVVSGGAMAPKATHETRNSANGIPHINMHP